MNASLLVAAVLASSTVGQSMYQQTVETQNKAFKKLWGTEFNWKFDELPASAKVAEDRVPYSGYIYPDTHGGTVTALSKYDRAFDQGLYTGHAPHIRTRYRHSGTRYGHRRARNGLDDGYLQGVVSRRY